jgi:hypothetical protein
MTKRNGKKPANGLKVLPYPERRWEQMSQLIQLFLLTAWVENCRSASLIIYGFPGMGKTELLEKYRVNRNLAFHSDMTVRQLYPALRQAERGAITHLVFTEFQKLFQRKGFVAENCIGTMAQAIEEGVTTVSVGPQELHFDNARLGILGAMTGRTFRKKHEMLSEMGFLDRVAFVEFDLYPEEIAEVVRRINAGDRSDLEPIRLAPPADGNVTVTFSDRVATELSTAMFEEIGDRTAGSPPLRLLQRLRALSMAAAVQRGDTDVHSVDVERVMQFKEYLVSRPKVIDAEAM